MTAVSPAPTFAMRFFIPILLLPLTAFADCPPGQVPGIDRFGNPACVSLAGNRIESVQSQPGMCPHGYHRVPDNFGGMACIDKATAQNATPRRANCPPGSVLRLNAWGTARCD